MRLTNAYLSCSTDRRLLVLSDRKMLVLSDRQTLILSCLVLSDRHLLVAMGSRQDLPLQFSAADNVAFVVVRRVPGIAADDEQRSVCLPLLQGGRSCRHRSPVNPKCRGPVKAIPVYCLPVLQAPGQVTAVPLQPCESRLPVKAIT